ncbi:DNA-(apurinic or apyrimidinic site) lyase [Carnobacterium iners]|uniref:Formamidopyrimidine-DNA glycosylase n=1 Tax=Carnobacterium iners TaxID=1073423 RepID=A0A1X7NPN7_9LACT|nr:DNA-formamidopyrimidine glycosylase [Carnobacterium iners]SEK27620.1 DNA-(apurinic or apyrimidinic site) lyase [Carnobacterium iners]SMH40042.1 DNA-(apurinic or apyrimidinic site) lyase [Carnobacterium iners]
MPELPEVETVRQGLLKLVKGSTIIGVDVYWDRIISGEIHSEDFASQLIGNRIIDINRRGKYLLFNFSHWSMISHLRMEGKYEVSETNEPLKKHTHIVFHLSDGRDLRYLDVRKFGRMTLVPKGEEFTVAGLKTIGPEPISETFDLTFFKKILKQKSRAIKPLLLEQKVVAGLGNIYVDEALFEAEIHPLRPAHSLRPKEVEQLHQSIIDVLRKAVLAGGTTIRSYKHALGKVGNFQVELHVYGKTNEPCTNCGTPIKKIKVAQRGTHICTNCQKLTTKNSLPRS